MTRPVLSEDELKALLATDLIEVRAQNRFWFWIRSGFVLCYILAISAAIVLFPDRVLSKFHFPAEMPVYLTQDYLLLRVATLLGAATLYVFSYWRDWYFSYVALAAIIMAIGNLVDDWFSLYIYVRPEALLTVQAIMIVRCVIVILLTMNFVATRKDVRQI